MFPDDSSHRPELGSKETDQLRMKKSLAVIVLAASLTGAGATAAQATTYPAPAPSSYVSSGSVVAGESVTFAGQGFTPGEQINITVTSGAAV